MDNEDKIKNINKLSGIDSMLKAFEKQNNMLIGPTKKINEILGITAASKLSEIALNSPFKKIAKSSGMDSMLKAFEKQSNMLIGSTRKINDVLGIAAASKLSEIALNSPFEKIAKSSGINSILKAFEKQNNMLSDSDKRIKDILGLTTKSKLSEIVLNNSFEKINRLSGIDSIIKVFEKQNNILSNSINTIGETLSDINLDKLNINSEGIVSYNEEPVNLHKKLEEISSCFEVDSLIGEKLNRFFNESDMKNPIICLIIIIFIVFPLVSMFNRFTKNQNIVPLENKVREIIENTNLEFNTGISKVKSYVNQVSINGKKAYNMIEDFKSKHPTLFWIIFIYYIEPLSKSFLDFRKKQLEKSIKTNLEILNLKGEKAAIKEIKQKSIKEIRESLNVKSLQMLFLNKYRFSKKDRLVVRMHYSWKSKIVARLNFGQVVNILYKNNKWSLIEFNDEGVTKTGWVSTCKLDRFD